MKHLFLGLLVALPASITHAITVADYESVMTHNAYASVDTLCPETIEQYGQDLSAHEAEIERARGTWKEFMIPEFEKYKLPVELCMELKIMKTNYDLVLSQNLLLKEETRGKVVEVLDSLTGCLKISTRRSEIENCNASFQASIRALLGL